MAIRCKPSILVDTQVTEQGCTRGFARVAHRPPQCCGGSYASAQGCGGSYASAQCCGGSYASAQGCGDRDRDRDRDRDS